MKLHSIKIKNFRAIESRFFDFTDIFSKPRKVTLIVGPNGSGKTSILDAIQIVVRTSENPENPKLREGLEFSAQQILRDSNRVAEIDFSYSFNSAEAEAINKLYKVLDNNPAPFSFKEDQPPLDIPSTAQWQFPDPSKPHFIITYPARHAAKVIGPRGEAASAVRFNRIEKSIFEKIGGVCYLDQRRSLMINKSIYAIEDEIDHDDVLSWLHIYYRKHLAWNEEKYGESYWSRIKRLFDRICYPSEIVGMESGPGTDTLIIKKEGLEYDLLQMSSGEHQILRLIVGLTVETAVNSIVLIDEVELHLHPTWQRRLISALREDSFSLNNQYIFTTHSQFVKQLFFEDEIIDLGDLDERV